MRTILPGVCTVLTLLSTTLSAEPAPLSELPDHVSYKKGTLSLFADYSNATKMGVHLIYVVNDSSDQVTFEGQDGDIYLKQEAKVEGEWVRSQPHRYSWCGNSYMPTPPLLPQHFTTFSSIYFGWAPPVLPNESDSVALLPVRYRIYSKEHFHLVSNEGELPVSRQLIRIASTDAMSVRFGQPDKLVALALGKFLDDSVDHIERQSYAISNLTRFPDDPLVEDAVRTLLLNRLSLKGEAHQMARSFREALEVAPEILEADEVWKIYSTILDDPEAWWPSEVLNALIHYVPDRREDKIARLDHCLRSYNHPLYTKALKLRCDFWDETTVRSKLQRVVEDTRAPQNVRSEIKEFYHRRFPNP